MPHLSPMHWILALILTTSLLLTLTSTSWWAQKQSFKTSSSTLKHSPSKWYWH